MIQAKEEDNIEFKWGKKRGVGGKKKDVQFYESFTYDGTEYTLYDSVYLYVDGDPEPYIGKLIKIWENIDKTKRVKILWFFRPYEISNYLNGITTFENELFLASGEGVGLANVNPLEAIAGKCNVICTSKDSRNPQPSNEELQTADFIFSRTFDVDCHVILDKIDDKIAQVDVKLLLNKVNSQKSSAVPEHDSIEKEISENAIVGNGIALSTEMNASGGHKTLKTDDSSLDPSPKENVDSTVLLDNQRSSFGQRPASYAHKDTDEMTKVDHTEEIFSGGKTISNFKVKDSAELITVGVKKKSSLEEKPTGVVGKKGNEAKISNLQKNTGGDKNNTRTRDKELADPKSSLVKQKSSLGEKHTSNVCVELDGMDKKKKQERTFNDKISSRSKDDFAKGVGEASKVAAAEAQAEEAVKNSETSIRFANRSSKKDTIGDAFEASDGNKEKIMQKSFHDSNNCDARAVDQTANASENISKRKLAKDFHETETISSKKPKLDEKVTKFPDGKLPRESPREVSNNVSKTGNKLFDVTRRPEADKSNWFTSQSWEERLQAAHKDNRLVLLQNLDPSYTGAEVEEIVQHALKQNCTAKMIPCAAFSSPHSGQAFAIFKTRDAAETAVTQLDKGCLMISNRRPLIGSIAKVSFPGKPSTFFGHMSIDKVRHQMQREMREAVSTSHCSQPNTIEYDMALDWCFLQEQTNLEWERLYKQHGKELRKLEGAMKSK